MEYIEVKFKDLKGKIIEKIEVSPCKEEVYFITNEGEYIWSHVTQCCEVCTLDDIAGDLNDLIGQEIVEAKEKVMGVCAVYTLRTLKHSIDFMWYSNSDSGYYTSEVTLYKVEERRI